MLKLLLLALVLIGLAIAGLAISMILKKNGKFPNTHISQNKALKEKGIQCASHDEYSCKSCSCHID